MNKQELQKKYQEIVLAINGGNDDYVVALCKIANAINELEDKKDLQSQLDQQKEMWKSLKNFIVNRPYYAGYDVQEYGMKVITDIIDKMQELEQGEKE